MLPRTPTLRRSRRSSTKAMLACGGVTDNVPLNGSRPSINLGGLIARGSVILRRQCASPRAALCFDYRARRSRHEDVRKLSKANIFRCSATPSVPLALPGNETVTFLRRAACRVRARPAGNLFNGRTPNPISLSLFFSSSAPCCNEHVAEPIQYPRNKSDQESYAFIRCFFFFFIRCLARRFPHPPLSLRVSPSVPFEREHPP